MPGTPKQRSKTSNLEGELYLLIAKFLSTGFCQRSAEVLRSEIEELQLLPKRTDWLGNEHSRSFNELEQTLSHVADDHLLKICSRIGAILDKEVPPTVPGVQSLLGAGRQSLLRTKEDAKRPKVGTDYLLSRYHGTPFYPSPALQNTYPPNIVQTLLSRELCGPVSCRHAFSSKLHARQQMFRRLLGHLSSVYCVLFDRTGKYILTGADDLLVKIWSAIDGRLLASLRGHSAEITDMAVNYENTLLASGSCDKNIRVWCLRTTAPVAVLSGHTGMVTSLQFCPYPKREDHYLLSTGNDGCVCFWVWNAKDNFFSPKPLKFTERNKAGAQMICSSFSPGGVFLATGSTDHHVRIYNIVGIDGPEKILEREAHSDRVDSLQFSNSDCRFVSGSKDGTALIWKYERQNWHTIVLRMTTRLPGYPVVDVEDTKIKLRVTMVGWTLDDGMVITAVSDYSIKVWDSFTGVLRHVLRGHEDEVFVLEAHPKDPRVFLSSGHDGRIILWDLVSGTAIRNHFNLIEGQGHGAVFDCKFSPDGQMFASTDSHGHLSIFGYGSSDRFKKIPEEQFFHTDYRPLIRDINHHVLDEQMQCAPHLLPPPFLVDIDGNPYPPNLQRLVPGREHCNDSQLIPYIAVSAEGDTEILEPVRPVDDSADPHRPTIDDMIEILQLERFRSGASGNEADGNNSERSFREPFSPHSGQSSFPENGERNIPETFSPRSSARGQAGHSRVGMRRSGDIEGVRQSSGNWQSRGSNPEVPAWTKRVVVKPMKPSLAQSSFKRLLVLADNELAFYNREKKRRQLPDLSETNYVKLESRSVRRQQKSGLRSRSARENVNHNNIYGEDYENPDSINFSSSSDSESDMKEIWDESSGEDSGSGEYSDWTADAGVNIEKSKQKTKSSTSGTGMPTTSRSRRHISSADDETEDAQEDNEDDVGDQSEKDSTGSSKKKRVGTQASKRKVTKGKLPVRYRPSEWLTDVMPHKAPYVPQIGDEIVYFRQGHELYVQAVRRGRIYDIYMKNQPFRKINLRDQEVARIDDITFEIVPPTLCCLKLTLLNPSGKTGDTFVMKYHDMADVIDFIVLKQNYDQAMGHDWMPGDRFRSAIDKAWWLGTIEEQKPLNPCFPDSMFQCFVVRWDNGEKEQMSPWDFEPINADRLPNEEGGSVAITAEERQAMMYSPGPREWSSFGHDYDCERIAKGLERIMEFSLAEPFVTPVDLNRYPMYAMVVEYPIDISMIKSRLENKFYRRLDAVKFDVRYIHKNALKFNEPGSRIVKQAKCLVDLCLKLIESPYCSDPRMLYQDMMEAKQSRSQDSQSELDVLCSESNSDDDRSPSNRMKRKKHQGMMNQPNKRVRLENLHYNSNSWKQQCMALLDSIFQWEDSTPFRYRVDPNDYPDYRSIIDSPMDLTTVQEKIKSNQYSSPTEFCKDMRLIFQNSRNYNTNKKSRIYSMTIRLSAMFEERIRCIASDWRSAVKYEEKLKNNQYVSNRRKPLPVAPADAIASTSSLNRPMNAGSLSRSASHLQPSYHKRDSFSRSGNSRSSNTSHAECSGTNSRYITSVLLKEANGAVNKKKMKPTKEEQRSSKSSIGMTRRGIFKNKIGHSLTNGEFKKSKAAIKMKKEISPKQRNVQVKRSTRAEAIFARRKLRNLETSGSESNTNEVNSDTDESNDSLNGGSDASQASYEIKQKSCSQKRKGALEKEFQQKLRPRSLQVPQFIHQTRSASLQAQSDRGMYHRPVRLHTRSSFHSRSSSPPASEQSGHQLRSSTYYTRSNKITSSPKTSGTRFSLRHRVPPKRHMLESDSDSSESDHIRLTARSKVVSNLINNTDSSPNSSSGQCSKSSSNNSSSTASEHLYEKGGSSSEFEYQKSNDERESNLKYEHQSRRSTRSATRDNSRATRSALHNMKPIVVPDKSPKGIQTRNRGQRTVRYEEESDEAYSNYIQDSETVSISSRGRLRKLTRHGRVMFSE